MHTHFHYHPAFSLSKEKRLCHLGPGDSAERANEIRTERFAMRDNADLVHARSIYDNQFNRREYSELSGKNPLDRSFLQAMILDGILPDRDDRFSTKAKDINVADPLHLESRTDREIGEWLQKNVSSPDILYSIAGDRAANPVDLGTMYRARIGEGRNEWLAEGKISDTTLVQIPFERYRNVQADIQKIFTFYGIGIPGLQTHEPLPQSDTLTRREYLVLLAQAWKGDITKEEIETAAKSRLPAVRTLIEAKADGAVGVQRMYVNLSLEELGPAESLSGIGIVIPPDLGKLYREAMQRPADEIVQKWDPAVGEYVPDFASRIAPEESAATWERYPQRAYPFLEKNMGAIPANRPFLDSLKWHFFLSPEERAAAGSAPLDEDDTRAVLSVISQHLLEQETVVSNIYQEQKDLKDKIFPAEKLKNTMGDVWETMKNFRENPLLSGLMWLGAFLAVRGIWKFAKGEHKNFTKWAVGLGLAGLTIGLYQQEKNGEAWWESLWNKASGWMGKERVKTPEKQTLPAYWSKELKMSTSQEQVILSIMGQHKVEDVLNWYSGMREWKDSGSPRDAVKPASPFSYDFKLRRYFGELNSAEQEEAFYQVTQKFLENRGAMIRRRTPENPDVLAIHSDDALGLAYMRDRYVEEGHIKLALVELIEKTTTLGVDTDLIINWNPNDPRLIEIRNVDAEEYLKLVSVHEEYEREVNRRATADWDMNTVFLMEADPAILRRMGREGAQAANVLETVEKHAKEFLPYLQGKAKELGIKIGEGLNWADKEVREFIEYMEPIINDLKNSTSEYAKNFKDAAIHFYKEDGKLVMKWLDKAGNEIAKFTANTLPEAKEFISTTISFLKKFPGEAIKFGYEAGKYVVTMLDSARREIGKFIWESYDHAMMKIYEIHGVPNDLYKKFLDNENFIQDHTNAGKEGLRVSIIGTDQVAIGIFDGIPGNNEGYMMELPIQEFAQADITKLRDVVKKWIDNAFIAKKVEIQTELASGRHPLLQKFEINTDPADGEFILYKNDPASANPQFRTSIYKFMSINPSTILETYLKNISNTATNTDIL